MKYRITNIINADVIIEDMNIRLAGKGSNVIVNTDIADRSKDLLMNRNLVKIDKIQETNMPIWPFTKPKLEQQPRHTQKPKDMHQDINEIKSLLSNILVVIESKLESVQSKTIVIERDAVIQSKTGMHEPMFIPSKITPDTAETDIKLREDEISNNNLKKSIEVLKKLKSIVK